MKLVIAVFALFWLISGIAGAKMLGELDRAHLKDIALGPITLARAFDEHPVSYPGPD